ncbi:MAG: response regulator [Nitrospirae bacterium]|nr:response regulator [Candidatus Manganitrophaceae bacterium]
MLKKILIADDEIPIRLLIHSTLESEEYEILEAVNGPDTIEKCLEQKPNLLILDLMMPGLSGEEVCKKIRSDPRTGSIPIIILTGRGKLTHDEAKRFDADIYLTKPFSPLELLDCVSRVLSRQG